MGSNLETVGKIYEAFGRGDIPFILEHLADDVQWEAWNDWTPHKAGVPWLASGTGKQAALAFFQVVGAWQFKDFQILALLDGGAKVAAEVQLSVELPGGAALQDEELHLWSFNDAGKVAHFRHYVDTAKHIAAAQGAQAATAAS